MIAIMIRISDQQFHHLHRKHIRSPWWRQHFAPLARKHYKWICAICQKRAWIVDHKKYKLPNGKLIFGQETLNDVRLLCARCNRKGVRSDIQIRQERKALWWRKAIEAITNRAWRIIVCILLLIPRVTIYFVRFCLGRMTGSK